MATPDRPRIESRTPLDLVHEVKRGLVRIPPFQRGFRWESADVIALFDSILRGFPVGNLLFWRRPAPAGHLRVGPLDIDAPKLDSAYWVVDGQQRITSLVGALVAAEESPDARFRIHLDLETSQFHSLGPRQQAPRHWLPVSRLFDTATLLAWLRENEDWLTETNAEIAEAATRALRDYQIPVYIMTADDESDAVEVFQRVNTSGKRLSRTEVFHALHSGFSGDEPDDLPSLGAVSAQMGFGSLDEHLVLQCMLAYRGGEVFRDYLGDEFSSEEDRRSTFREVAGALRAAVGFLQDTAGIPHVRLLPRPHVLPVLTRFIRVHEEPIGRVAELLRRWVWRDAVAQDTDATDMVAAAGATDPYAAVQALLRLVPQSTRFVPDLEEVYLDHAAAKVNLLGLLSTEPRDLIRGQPIDVVAALETTLPLRKIVVAPGVPFGQSLANRIVADSRTIWPVHIELGDASEEVATSHLVDSVGQQLLRSNDVAAFLRRRADTVSNALAKHVDAMAEWGARDGRSVADMMRSVAS